jgi:hypothetical protein
MLNPILSKNEAFLNLEIELSKTIPNFTRIAEAIEKTPPSILSLAITNDMGFTYLIDYYFRHIDNRIVKSILQHPMFEHEALKELFSCQVTAYDKALIQGKPLPDLFSSYWSNLSKAEYAILFQTLVKSQSNTFVLKGILEKVDLVHIRMMTASGTIKSDQLLSFFKNLGSDLQKFAAKDMNIYDFAVDLAITNSDETFLNFLDEYTLVFVQLRMVASFVEEVESQIKKNNGKNLTYLEIMTICSHIPKDCIEVTLDIYHDKKWVSLNEKKSILEFYGK